MKNDRQALAWNNNIGTRREERKAEGSELKPITDNRKPRTENREPSHPFFNRSTLVIVDFDGTMVDLAVDWEGLKGWLQYHANEQGWAWNQVAGLDVNLRRIREAQGEDAFNMLCSLVTEVEINGFEEDRINTTLVDTLRGQSHKGLAVVSANTRAALTELFQHPAFEGLEPYIIAKEDVQHGKPHPEGLLKACARFGVGSDEGFYIGDAPTDRAAAEALRMPFLPVDEVV